MTWPHGRIQWQVQMLLPDPALWEMTASSVFSTQNRVAGFFSLVHLSSKSGGAPAHFMLPSNAECECLKEPWKPPIPGCYDLSRRPAETTQLPKTPDWPSFIPRSSPKTQGYLCSFETTHHSFSF